MAIRLRVYGIDDAIPFALGCLAKYRPPRRAKGCMKMVCSCSRKWGCPPRQPAPISLWGPRTIAFLLRDRQPVRIGGQLTDDLTPARLHHLHLASC